MIDRIIKAVDSKSYSAIDQCIQDEPKEIGSMLNYASLKGNFAVVKYLIEIKKADPQAIDYCPGTYSKDPPLKFAALSGNLDLVIYLVEEKKVNIEANESYAGTRYTALMGAAYHGHDAVVQYLISKGANVNSRNNQFLLSEAIESKKLPVVRTLVEAGCRIERNDLHAALLTGNFDLVRYLCQQNPSVINQVYLAAWPCVAVEGGNIEVVKYLEIEQGVLLTKRFRSDKIDDTEYKLLVAGSMSGSIEMMRYLVDTRKLNLDKFKKRDFVECHSYRSILGYAASQHKSITMMKYLMEEKAFMPSADGIKELMKEAHKHKNIITKAYLQSHLEVSPVKKSILLKIANQGLSSLSLYELFQLQISELLYKFDYSYSSDCNNELIEKEIDARSFSEFSDLVKDHFELMRDFLFYYAQDKFEENFERLIYLLNHIDKPLDDYTSPKGETLALYVSIRNRNRYSNIVKELIARGTEIDKPSGDGYTLLYRLSSSNESDINYIPQVLKDSKEYHNTLRYACRVNHEKYNVNQIYNTIQDLLTYTRGDIGFFGWPWQKEIYIKSLVLDAMANGNLRTLLTYVNSDTRYTMERILDKYNNLMQKEIPQLKPYKGFLMFSNQVNQGVSHAHEKDENKTILNQIK